MKKPIKQPARNLHAIAPIMRKGGAHEKPYRTERSSSRRELKKHLREANGRSHSADADLPLVA